MKPLTLIKRLGGIIGLGVMICSCTLSIPPSTTAIREVMSQRHRQQAVQLMEQDKLAEALIQWKILHAIMPGEDEIVRQINEIQTIIQQRVKVYLQYGQNYMKRRQYQQAKRAFLAALALDPSQSMAHSYLRHIEHMRMKQALQHKLAQYAYSTRKLPLIPRQACHRFHANPATDSRRKLPAIPRQNCH